MTDNTNKRTIESVEQGKDIRDDVPKNKILKIDEKVENKIEKDEEQEQKKENEKNDNKITEKELKDERTEERDVKTKENKSQTPNDNENENKKESTNTANKFVFGSTTSFGNMGGFKMFGSSRKNVFSSFSKSSQEETKESSGKKNHDTKINDSSKATEKGLTKEKTSTKENEIPDDKTTNEENDSKTLKSNIFGSGSTFGNAFQTAINKKSVFDELKSNTENKSTEANQEENKEEGNEKDVYKQVHLEKQDVKSGEENEETIFQVKAKLYHMELSKMSEGWKERGFGIIKVNKFLDPPSDSYTSRLVMRQNGNLKLILNLPIVNGFHTIKGMPSSLSANKFIRIQILESGEPVQYAIKVGQAENSEKLFKTIQDQIPK